ncbi:unnamed protein product [Mytilus edulis]|uniref:Farnesoic acid O-methyl transferase domain-containing protein n=1 Tax=Mytilus edulis TaxID=6550 RepID=A0A8S3R326_MYTED|nr:unnamed protein product [Mytilus edulis]
MNGLINFKVQSCNDVHFALISGQTEYDPLYEIVIGGWGNSKSVIRTSKQGSPVAQTYGSYLNCNELVEFWISWSNITITLGTGVKTFNNTGFLTWSLQSGLLSILDSGFYTAFGSTGEWIFYTQETTTEAIEITTTSSCMCPCVHNISHIDSSNLTKEELMIILHDELQLLKNTLRIEKKFSSKYLRRLTSAPDNRTSSKSMGSIAVCGCGSPYFMSIFSLAALQRYYKDLAFKYATIQYTSFVTNKPLYTVYPT